MDGDFLERMLRDARGEAGERVLRLHAEADLDGEAVGHGFAAGLEHAEEDVLVFGQSASPALSGDHLPGAAAVEVHLRVAEVLQGLRHDAQGGGVLADDLGHGADRATGLGEDVREELGHDAGAGDEGDEGRDGVVDAAESFGVEASERRHGDAAQRGEGYRGSSCGLDGVHRREASGFCV